MASNAANIGNQAIQAYGNQRTVVPSAGGGLLKTPAQAADPFNWKGIAAQLKKEEQRKAAAKRRIQTPSAPKSLQAGAPAPAAPSQKELLDAYRAMNNGELPPDITPEMAALIDAAPAPGTPTSPKELLDSFRAFNGGALPPGMTPEAAAMIDQGIDIASIAAVNPAIAGVISQMQSLITQLPADYAAGKASVNQSYDTLTGDVLKSGETWMKDLYGRTVDPNDPNAALMQQDPALTAYAQGMSTIDETSDLNRATDLAWFDKMQSNADATYKGLIAALAAQAATPVAAKGGGGGGGGGRRGGRGGGGGSGSGVNGWKIPTNTVTNLESATDTATQTDTGYSPGFHEALLESTSGDPNLQALAQRIWETTSDQSARGVTNEAAKRLTETETSQEDLAIQQELNKAWIANQPLAAQAAITRLLRNNPGAVLGDDPTTPRVEPWYMPKVPGQNTPTVIQPTEQQGIENALAEELLAGQSKYGARDLTRSIFGKGASQEMPVGVASPVNLQEQRTKGMISPTQMRILEAQGKTALSKAKSEIPGDKFDIQSWAEGGGFVPYGERQTKLQQENAQNEDYLNYILDAVLPWNPNANTVPTQEKMVSQGKDSSTYQSKTTNKSNLFALPGSTLDLTPTIPGIAVQSNPMTNPEGFTITPGDTLEDDETVEVSPLGLGIGTNTLSVGKGQVPKAVTDSFSVIKGLNRPQIQSAATDRIRTPFGTVTRPQPAPAPVAKTPIKRPRVVTKTDAAESKALFGLKIPDALKKKLSGKKAAPAKKTVASRLGPK